MASSMKAGLISFNTPVSCCTLFLLGGYMRDRLIIVTCYAITYVANGSLLKYYEEEQTTYNGNGIEANMVTNR